MPQAHPLWPETLYHTRYIMTGTALLSATSVSLFLSLHVFLRQQHIVSRLPVEAKSTVRNIKRNAIYANKHLPDVEPRRLEYDH